MNDEQPLREADALGPIAADDVAALRTIMEGIGKTIESVGRATMERLLTYRWPGNVRELENVLERAVILASGPVLEIDPEVIPVAESATPPSHVARLEDVERNHIRDVLERTNWVIEGARGAATILGLHPNTLRSRMKKLGLARVAHEPS